MKPTMFNCESQLPTLLRKVIAGGSLSLFILCLSLGGGIAAESDNFGLGSLPLMSDAQTRSISPENPTGEKGKGAMNCF